MSRRDQSQTRPSVPLADPIRQRRGRPSRAANAPSSARREAIDRWQESFRGCEVISRPVGFFFREFEQLGHPTDDLLDGIALTREELTSRHGRIGWESMRVLMRNVGRVWNDDELVEAGKRLSGSKWIRPFALVARLLYSADDLYRWNFRPVTGGSAKFFTCIENALTEIGPGHISIDTWMAPGYRPSPELYRMFTGALIQMPRVVGLGPATVEFEDYGDGTVRFDIRYPTGGGLLGPLRRALVWPFMARSTARELEEATEQVFERHGELARQTRELASATAALQESEELFRTVFNAAPSPMIVSSVDGQIIDVNEVFVSFTGYRRNDLLGRNTADFGFWKDPTMRSRIIERLENGELVRGIEANFRIRNAESRVALVSAAKATLAGESRVVWTAVDITDRKAAEDENRILQERIIQAQKLESLGVMAGGIAHDFNNLLVGMLGNAELALGELDADDDLLRERLEAIRLASERAADLINKMLTYAGKTESSRQPVDLAALVAETAALLRSSLPKNVTIGDRTDAAALWIEGDPTQLRQVVMNLMTNAAESFDDSGGQVEVVTGVVEADRDLLDDTYLDEALPTGKYAMVEVSDSGCGMDSETLKRIFEPFFSTKFTGRGLGLAATLGIVRAHRGTLRVRSDVSRGTHFQILLPITEERPRAQTGTAAPGATGGRVLVVDDEEVVRKVTMSMLERIGYHTLGAASGEEALATPRTHGAGVSAVILDLTMPGMSGDQTFRTLRNIVPDLPVLCCTGHGDEVGARWIENKRRVSYLSKPFLLRELRDALAALGEPLEIAEPG